MRVAREKSSALALMLFVDQVARDLDIVYHAATIAKYEKWYWLGFEMDPNIW